MPTQLPIEPEILAAGAAAVAALLGLVAWLLVRRKRRRSSAADAGVLAGGPVGPGERLRRGLAATRRRLGEQLDAILGRGPRPLDVILEELEETLIGADVGVRTTASLLEPVRRLSASEASPDRLRELLRDSLRSILAAPPAPEPTTRPWVILVTGINGVGKTTTVGKLAARYVGQGKRVLLVAADTFRAAAIEQLAVWADRTGADLVRHAQGADPSAVVFDGLKAALARNVDIVLIDTAGRLHTKTPLIEELAKVGRVIGREVPGAPHETLLVVDATTGQNALSQAKVFQAAVPLTGVVLTKLDGTARGGVLVAIRNELGLPIRDVGVGEGVDDLRPFDASEFAEALFASERG